MLLNFNKNRLIYPYESRALNLWAKKWGIEIHHINEAIIATGSIRAATIKQHLAKKGLIFSFKQFSGNVKNRLKILAAKFTGDEDYY